MLTACGTKRIKKCKRLHESNVSAYNEPESVAKGIAMFLFASLVVFIIYFSNVAMGALAGNTFLSDVGEMLVLFAATILFVVAILKKEADRKKKNGG
jgi:uncharacterized protein (DUF2062 family)